jgi:DNA polymerase-3 subunit epsilon
MKLNLKRPLAFFDIEATGTNIGVDRIVEIAIIKLFPDGSEEVKAWRINPEMPIPLEASLIHGIYDEHIAAEPSFKQVAQEVAAFIEACDLAGYNSNKFDIPMLMEEFLRAGVAYDIEKCHFVDVQNIFHQMEQRTLKAAYRFYCSKEIINAHSAEADTRATMEVLLAQIEKYENAEWEDREGKRSVPVVGDVEALHQFTCMNNNVDFAGRMVFNGNGEAVFNFGKHKGKKVEDVFDIEPSYFSWMMQGDFPLYTKRKLEEIYKKWNAAKNAERAQRAPQPKAADDHAQKANQQQPKKEFNPNFKKDFQKRDFKPQQQQQQQQGRPYKKDEPATPVNDDMLKMLADKFKKG